MQEFSNNTFLVGAKPILEALQENPTTVLSITILNHKSNTYITKIIELCKQYNIHFMFKDLQYLNRLYPYNHKGIVAKITRATLFSLEDIAHHALHSHLPLLIALDMITDIGNFGTIARTLYALGGAGIILPRHGSVTPNETAMATSAGALRSLPVSIVTNMAQSLQWLYKQGFAVYGTSCDDGESIFATSLMLPAVLVLGSEEKGIRPLVLKQCSHLVTIDMHNACNSINVAQSAAICISLFSRLRYTS
ncbi:MAG: 23S rRNA (guanosine(2251)-2'-O)-methyltransferase RlmB [Desulfovibrionaceae bacterium]|nr:23S rRNA (guanosine(2251)-2'-O)-methyltransferase RlmB [Desulfovibrionaceae bacterium]